jgi:hypothetical protein
MTLKQNKETCAIWVLALSWLYIDKLADDFQSALIEEKGAWCRLR